MQTWVSYPTNPVENDIFFEAESFHSKFYDGVPRVIYTAYWHSFSGSLGLLACSSGINRLESVCKS